HTSQPVISAPAGGAQRNREMVGRIRRSQRSMMIILLGAVLLLGASAATAQSEDPDLPSFATVDMGTYLKLRAEHTAIRRGVEPGRPFDPGRRMRATRQMEAQLNSVQLLAPAISS